MLWQEKVENEISATVEMPSARFISAEASLPGGCATTKDLELSEKIVPPQKMKSKLIL